MLPARTGVRYLSNVYSNADQRADDFVLTFIPGAEIVMGKQSIYGVTLRFYEIMDFYMDNYELTNYRENVELDTFL